MDINVASIEGIKLPPEFYLQSNVVSVTRQLLGKVLVTAFDGQFTAGRIVEAEAYNGQFDKASHAYNNRRTRRTEIMYAEGGVAYVYLCYGLHQMFNVVTGKANIPNAVLIRAVEPIAGIDTMLLRTKKLTADHTLTRGPGNVGKALGLHTQHSGLSLQSSELCIIDDGTTYPDEQLVATERIGVGYAAEDALLPYRLLVANSRYVSGKKGLLQSA